MTTREADLDLVCGMSVAVDADKPSFTHEGKTYRFCGKGCKTKFEARPEHYIAHPAPPRPPKVQQTPTPIEGAVYICPMDPEVRETKPGPCPICGMALEPLLVSASDAPDPELVSMTRRFFFAGALTLPIFALEMGSHIVPALHHLVPARTSGYVQLALSAPVVFWAGLPFFERALTSLRTRKLNMFTLIAMGTGVAWLYSLFAVLAPELFPAGFRAADGAVAVYFEAAAVITLLVLLGQILELRARAQTTHALRALLDLSPKRAFRVDDAGVDHEIPLEQVALGDRLRIRPGEQVPVDGVVLEGRSAIDESMITGEPMPVTKKVDDPLIGGTLNTTGALVMRATRVGAETMLARIVQRVSEASRSRAPIERVVDRVSALFVPTVLAVAALTFVAWALFGPEPRLAYALVSAVSVLIVACPCALGLATPMSIMVGVGKGARLGVLIKNAEALERLERLDTLIVDKTGTLTTGKPELVRIVALGARGEDTLLRVAASVERASEHPLAHAIVSAAKARALALDEVSAFDAPLGKGVRGTLGGERVLLGNQAFLLEEGVDASAHASEADALREDGATVIFVAIDAEVAGLLVIADPIAETTEQALRALRAEGIRIVMATGDSARSAHAIARALGIEEVHAEQLPEQKQALVRASMSKGKVVAMVGDGVNDAPALALADVGIAMSHGTDVAIESAGVTLLRGELLGIVRALSLSKATMRNVRQNLAFAFVYNAACIPLAAGVLYPISGWLLSPMIAAAAMSLSSVSVIANALRLRATSLSA